MMVTEYCIAVITELLRVAQNNERVHLTKCNLIKVITKGRVLINALMKLYDPSMRKNITQFQQSGP